MVHLGILAHELSQLEGKPDQYTGFPTDIKNMGGGGVRVNTWGAWGGFQEKRKYLVNICTVACKLKNVVFLLNKDSLN